jgi:hypothetical protein
VFTFIKRCKQKDKKRLHFNFRVMEKNKDYEELITLYDRFRLLSSDKESNQKELDEIEDEINKRVMKIFENEPI